MQKNEWFSALVSLIADCSDPETKPHHDLLQRFVGLMATSPSEVSDYLQIERPFDEIKSLVDRAAYLSAIDGLAGSTGGVMMSRSPVGECIATVVFPGLTDEVSFRSTDLAVAYAGALSAAIFSGFSPPDVSNQSFSQTAGHRPHHPQSPS